jgi:predicted ATPase/DNA-binding SARP family transcriptional activator
VSFSVLGVVAAFDPNGEMLSLGSNRRRAVLAASLVNFGHPLSVDQLIDMLWNGMPPPTASTMVHGAVAGLRRSLESTRRAGAAQLLATRGGGYVLDVDPEQLDVFRFERLLAQGRQLADASPSRAAALLTDALMLWRGPALAGLDQRFARDAAARLDELCVECAELRMAAALELGRHHEVVADLESLAARHPLRERLHAQLVMALYRCGRPSDALAACRRLRSTLDTELGVEPGSELRDLELAVLRRSDELELRVPVKAGAGQGGHALPAQISPFVGRARELQELAALLPTHRLVTLTGTGGSGKTRLALEVAGRIAAGGLVDAMLVDLASVTTSNLFDATIADALGVRAEPGQALTATIVAALAGHEAVIVLDNCEHLLDECASFVQLLLAASTGVRLLTTSREPLAVPGELVYSVRPLQMAASDDDLDRIAACEAVELFTSRAATARAGFVITANDAQLVLEICRRVDGLPLAIELAAARAASMSLDDLAGLLGDRFRLLDSAVRTADARHRSLATTMAWSYDLLTEAERVLFARVSVFPTAFDLEATRAVAGGSELLGHDVVLLLSRLVVCSTVQLEDGGAAGAGNRYRLLETTRQFARRCLTEPELLEMRERHARHYLARVQEAERHLFGAGSAPWLARLQGESDNLRAALEWSFGPTGDPQVGIGLVAGLWHYWDLRGARGEGLHWVHAGLDAIGADRPHDRMPLLSAGALLHIGRSDFETTEVQAGEQLTLARKARAQAWEGNALAMLATTAWARGRFDRAQQLYEDAITASIKGGDLWRAALEEAQLARLHRDRNEPDAAKAIALRSLAHAVEVGEELARGLAVDVLASVEHRWGDVSQARTLADEALAHYRLVGYQEGEASALHLAGQIALAAHERGPAGAAFERSLQLCRRIGHRAGAAAALQGLASVATAGADNETAARLAGDAAALRAEIGIPLPA